MEPDLFSCEYGRNGNLVVRTDARAAEICYGTYSQNVCQQNGYDGRNRLLTKSYKAFGTAAPTPPVTYTYDADLRLSGDTSPNQPQGRLVRVSNENSTTTFHRIDAFGRVLVSSQAVGGQTWYFQGPAPSGSGYEYNLAGDLTAMTYPSGRRVATTFDAAGRPTAMVGTAGGVNSFYVTSTSYAPHGGPKTMSASGGALVQSAEYNSRQQMRRSLVQRGASALLDLKYWHSDGSPAGDEGLFGLISLYDVG